MSFAVGDVVMSTAGHDRGTLLAVVRVEDGYVWVADGQTRRLDAPKRKNPGHLSSVGRFDEDVSFQLLQRCGEFEVKRGTGDAGLRKRLKAFTIEF